MAPVAKRTAKRMSPNRRLQPVSTEVECKLFLAIPFNHFVRLNRSSLLDQIRGRQARPQNHEAEDTEGPRDANRCQQGIEDEANNSTSKAATSIDDSIGDSALGLKVLGGNGRDNLEAHKRVISNQPSFDTTMKQRLVPTPPTTPQVMNKPAILSVANPLRMLPSPRRKIPRRAVRRTPITRITLALGTASSEIHAGHKDPTNASVEEEYPICSTRAACETPHVYEAPTNHHVTTAQAEISNHPYPPSGTWESARIEACITSSDSGAACTWRCLSPVVVCLIAGSSTAVEGRVCVIVAMIAVQSV